MSFGKPRNFQEPTPRRASTLPASFDIPALQSLPLDARRRLWQECHYPSQRRWYEDSPLWTRSPSRTSSYQTYENEEEKDEAGEHGRFSLRGRGINSRIRSPTPGAVRSNTGREFDAAYMETQSSRVPRSRDCNTPFYDEGFDENELRWGRTSGGSVYPEDQCAARRSSTRTDRYMVTPSNITQNGSRARFSEESPVVIGNTIDDDSDDSWFPPLRRHHSRGVDVKITTQAYPFTLSRYHQNDLNPDNTAGSMIDSTEKEQSQEPIDLKQTSRPGEVQHILCSQYVSDRVTGGSHAVQLTIAPEVGRKSGGDVASLFKWIHFEDMNMDYEQFQINTLSISGLTNSEKAAISKLLARAKKKHDKSIRTTREIQTKFMCPSFLQEKLPGEPQSKSSRTRTIYWMCVPYFCLDKYAEPSSLRASAHPMRTLHQAHLSLIQKEKDLQQAVCHLKDTPAGYCFHIAQLWLLVLDHSMIVSCARSSISALQEECITIISKPATKRPLPSSQIIFSYDNSILWAFPVHECETWFALLSHFRELWPCPFQIKYNERIVTAENWPRVLLITRKGNIHLSVEFLINPFVKEPAKGTLLFEISASGEAANPIVPDPIKVPKTTNSQASSAPSPTVNETSDGRHKKTAHLRSQNDDEGFHVFTWMRASNKHPNHTPTPTTANSSCTPPPSEHNLIDGDLDEIDSFLKLQANLNDRLTYKNCPLHEKTEVYKMLLEERKEVMEESDTSQTRSKRFEMVVDILNAAESLFQFFLPPKFEGATVQKFWGALYRLLDVMLAKTALGDEWNRRDPGLYTDTSTLNFIAWLKITVQEILPFREFFSQVRPSDCSGVQVPEELPRAWLYLLLSLTFTTKDMQLSLKQIAICHGLLEMGMMAMMKQVSKWSLSDYTVLPPFGLANLVAFSLLQDVKGWGPDITDTYLQYLKLLESDVEAKPLDRSHQQRISAFKAEISAIYETLVLQKKVLSQAQIVSSGTGARIGPCLTHRRSRSPSSSQHGRTFEEEYAHSFAATTGGSCLEIPAIASFAMASRDDQQLLINLNGIHSLVIQDSLALVEKRISEFERMRGEARKLEIWTMQEIDYNKDRREAAIYAFTIVTIIFLPLSTVASILGMNTYDVRNMDARQWVFWAIAIPLTVIIITLCLIWAGELRNFWDGFGRLWGKKPGSYVRIPKECVVVDQRRPFYRNDPVFGKEMAMGA